MEEPGQLKRAIMIVSWIKPEFPTYKLNVDGSSLGNPGFSGGGIVVRDSYGRQQCVAEARYYGIGTSVRAEILALLQGLERCVELGFFQVW
jgi:ribonuclease HI